MDKTHIPHPKVSHYEFWSIDDLGLVAGQIILSILSNLSYQPLVPNYVKTNCASCGCGMLDKNNVLGIYDEVYAQDYNQRFLLNEKSKQNTDFEEETISKLLDEIGEGATWLDVACGTGYFLSRFPNIERAGLDLSPAMLEVAQQANPDSLFVQGDYRDKRPQWEEKWDLVTCMWWAYGYVESLPQLESVIENLADWTTERGVCFLPVCEPAGLGTGEIRLPYACKNLGGNGGLVQFEGVIWSWIDEKSGKQHLNMLAPQLEYMIALFSKYFEQVEVIEYLVFQGASRKAIVARSKKQKNVVETKVPVATPTASEFSSSFFKAIRSQDWWLYKIPPLLAIAYAEILLLDLPVLQSVLTVSALLFAIACVAAYGHIINDSFDIEADRQVGKSNSMAQFSPWQRTLFCFVLAGLGFILPILMNFATLPTVLLGINYLLPTLYSAPPFRFKEKGRLGIISDAAGAHAIPTLFVATTFSHLVALPPLQATVLAIAATAWSFCAGIRAILLHQLWDLDNDLQTNVKTLVTESGVEKVRFWMSRIIFPLELLLLGSVILIISNSASLVLVFTIFYFLLKITLSKLDPKATFDPAPIQKSYVVPHDFYEVGLPLILATALSLQNKWFVLLLLLQVILFYPGIERRVTNLVQSLRYKPQNLQPMQAQLNASQAEVMQLNSRLHQTQNQLEQVQNQLQQLQTESQHHRSQIQKALAKSQTDLQQVQAQFREVQTQLQQVTEKFTQAESERQTSQAEVARLKSYLQETQGIQGVINYYRHASASSLDDIQFYHQALTIKPDDDEILLQLGNALVRQNRLDDAIAAYRRAIELNPDNERSHKYLGDILAQRGQINEASVCYRRVLQLQPIT